MNDRRALAELLAELADSVGALSGSGGNTPVRVRSLSLRVPIDLRLAQTDEGLEVLGDVPLFLTRTEFDPDPAHLEVGWRAVPVATGDGS